MKILFAPFNNSNVEETEKIFEEFKGIADVYLESVKVAEKIRYALSIGCTHILLIGESYPLLKNLSTGEMKDIQDLKQLKEL